MGSYSRLPTLDNTNINGSDNSNNRTSLTSSAGSAKEYDKKWASHNYRVSNPLTEEKDQLGYRKHKSFSDLSDIRGVQPTFQILNTQYYSHHESKHYSSSRKRLNQHNLRGSADETTPLVGEKEKRPWYDPEGLVYCFFVLFWCCLCYIGGYYIYDSIGVVEKSMEKFYDINAGKFGLLYSVYSLPNIIIPFFGGVILDRLGLRFGLFFCTLLMMIGSGLVAVSVLFKSFPTALAGRFIFGMGAETSYVALDTIVVTWFAAKAVGLAMGICVSAGRMGTYLTFNLNPWAIKHFHSWKATVWVAAAFGVTAFVSACVFYVLDKYAEAKKKKRKQLQINEAEKHEVPESINFKVIGTFPLQFWLICILVTTYYAVVFPFESTATKMLSVRYHYSETKAGRIISLLPLTSMILSPPCGFIVDKIGRRPLLVFLGEILMAGAILYMAFTNSGPIPSVLAIGVVFSLVPAALWPCIPIVVTGQFATAFGLMTSVMNLGLFLTYYLQGLVDDVFNGNTKYALIFYAGLAGVGLVLSAIWILLDIRDGGKCSKANSPPIEH